MNNFIKCITVICLGMSTIIAMTTDLFMGGMAMILFGIFSCVLAGI